MPIEVDINGYDPDTGVGNIVAKVRLEDNFRWHRIAGHGSKAVDQRYKFPDSGSWQQWGVTPVPGPTTPLRGAVMLNVPNLVGVGMFLGDFFPAETGKSGGGTTTPGQGGAWPRSKVSWRITLAVNFLNLNFQQKYSIALELAESEFKKRFGPALYDALKDPTMIAMIGLHFLRKPWMWLAVLKKVVGTVFAFWTIVQLAYQFNGVLIDIDTAQSESQLRAAGLEYADFLASLTAQLSIGLVLLLDEARRAVRDAANKRKDDPPPDSNDRTPPDPPAEEPPPVYRSWRDGIRDLENKARDLENRADPSRPAQYVYFLERAAGYRIQIAWWNRFVIETAHHIQWVRACGPVVQRYAHRLRVEVNNHGGNYNAGIAMIRADMAAAHIPLALDDAHIRPLVRALYNIGEIDWSMHDTETWLTSKFNEFVSKGLKNPINLRSLNWTEGQLREAAAGRDPRPGHNGRPFTEADLEEIFGDQLTDYMRAYGPAREIFRAGLDADLSQKQHTQSTPHHQPTAGLERDAKGEWSDPRYFSAMLEGGCDVAHAMWQDRAYRKTLFTFDQVVQMNATKPFVLFGLMILRGFPEAEVVHPNTVSEATLNGLGMADKLAEARAIPNRSH